MTKDKKMTPSGKPTVTAEYLLTHGFRQYDSSSDDDVIEIIFEGGSSLHFREIEHHRQMFVVVLYPRMGDVELGYSADVYVQVDVGCGFVEIPFPWWDLTIEQFESVYWGIRGEKPKKMCDCMMQLESCNGIDCTNKISIP